MSSCDAARPDATATTDCCTNCPAVVATVLFDKLALVGSAITLPPFHTRSLSELALEKRRGNTMSRSAGEGRYELAFVRAARASIASSLRMPEDEGGWR